MRAPKWRSDLIGSLLRPTERLWDSLLQSLPFPSIRRRAPPHHHRPRHGVDFHPVVGHLGHFLTGEPRRIFDRLLHDRVRSAVGNHIKPVAIAAVPRHAPFVGREQDRAHGLSQALDLDEPQFAGVEVQVDDIVAQILLVDVINLAALGS